MIERLLVPTELVSESTSSELTAVSSSSLVDYDIVGNNTLLLGEKTCVACGLSIGDESYLRVHKHGIFHEHCLTCYLCHRTLISIGGGYYLRNSYDQQAHFICRDDYQTIHQNKSSFSQCSKCQTMLSANELVMRADEKLIYHLDCFTCCLCNVLLKPGDDYGLHGSLLFCRLHSEQTCQTSFSLCSPIKSTNNNSNPTTSSNAKKSRQNSTQRKQRSKLNTLENNSNNLEMNGFLSGTDLSNSETSYSSSLFNTPSTSNPQQRTKRNRTSFKHHQLRIMKTFFAQNHNPDSKGLKILSQKTQLSKRVLQVWFQNARAKLRRGLLQEQENKQQKASTSVDNSHSADQHSSQEFLQMLTDDELASGTSNDRSRTEEDDELIDEFDDYESNATQESSTTNITSTHEFNHHHHLMPPYSLYPLL